MIPVVGSVWGDPARPETWRRVKAVDWAGDIWFGTFASPGIESLAKWSAFSSGAVDITARLAEKEKGEKG